MKTDSIFYRLFQIFPNILFELIHHPPEEANLYQFSSVEVKQLAFRIDGVFLPSSDAANHPIYFVEVQFQPDKKFYSRFFAEIFNYLDKTELTNNWRGVVIYPGRSIDTSETERYIELLASERVTRIYLDELDSTLEQPIGVETVKLVITSEEAAPAKARELLQKVEQRVADEASKQQIIQLIETIILYKFPNKSRQEIERMLELGDIKKTRVYQEAKEEGSLQAKLESIPRFLEMGLSLEQIAIGLGLNVEEVRKVVEQQSGNE